MNNTMTSKLVSFDQLHHISTENKDKLNRSIWTEKLLEENPNVKNEQFLLLKVLEHHHHLGKPVDTHYRTMTHYNGHLLFQDVTIEQWNNLKDK